MAAALPQCSHITRKRGIYYFRKRLPQPHGEIALSLRTRHYREAEHLAWGLTQRWFGLAAEEIVDQEKLRTVLARELDRLLREGRERIIRTPYGEPAFVGNYEDGADVASQTDLEATDRAIAQFSADLAKRDLRGPEPIIRKLMAENDIPDSDFQEFGLAWFKVYIEAHKRYRHWLEHGPFELDDIVAPQTQAAQAQPQAHQPPPVPAPPQAPFLSAVLPGFIDLMVSTGEWTAQTRNQNTTTYRMFTEVCGDRPVTGYSRKDLAAFYDTLRALPSLYSKKPEWSSLPLTTVVEQTRTMDVDRLAMKTIKRHFSALGRLFDYLKKRGEIEGDNPARGFDFPVGNVRASEGRQMWEGEKLRKLFSSPVWTGCASERNRATPGPRIIKDEKFWLPLLGLYHGNRLEEFAQLVRSDIREEDGIVFLDINDENGKKLKNVQSRRQVPLHPRLKELGFLGYVDRIATEPGARIFPELQPGGPDKRLGYSFSKWFTRYRQSTGLYEDGLDYHSFRHGVTTKLFGAGCDKVIVDALTGHEGSGTSERVYLKKLPLTRLYDAICTVQWPELDDVFVSSGVSRALSAPADRP